MTQGTQGFLRSPICGASSFPAAVLKIVVVRLRLLKESVGRDKYPRCFSPASVGWFGTDRFFRTTQTSSVSSNDLLRLVRTDRSS